MNKNQNVQEKGKDNGNDSWEPDLHWLADGLAVGGCFPPGRETELSREHGIGAVVDLREEERDEEERLAAAGIAFLHLPTRDLEPASASMLDQGVRFVRAQIERGNKVLIHCQHGIGRAPLLALCVLVELGFEPIAALELAKEARSIVSPSRSQYEGWAAWLSSRGLAPPDYHSFGCIAYRHLAKS